MSLSRSASVNTALASLDCPYRVHRAPDIVSVGVDSNQRGCGVDNNRGWSLIRGCLYKK